MKFKILICLLLTCFSALAQFKPTPSSIYYFPQFTTGPLSSGNTWFVLNQGGTNGFNIHGTNFFRFINEITPADYKLATLTQLTQASNAIVDLIGDGGPGGSVAFEDITSKPTTIVGYGITDAFDGVFNSLTSKPTTIGGYGITDFNSLGDARWQPLDTELTAWSLLATSAKQDADADLTDLADGTLTGSKVGSGINGDNVTSGTVASARIDGAQATDSELASAVAITASGFDGNLTTSDNTIQELAQKVDDLVLGGSSDYDTNTFTGTGALVRSDEPTINNPTFTGTVNIAAMNVTNLFSTTTGNTNALPWWDANGQLTNTPTLSGALLTSGTIPATALAFVSGTGATVVLSNNPVMYTATNVGHFKVSGGGRFYLGETAWVQDSGGWQLNSSLRPVSAGAALGAAAAPWLGSFTALTASLHITATNGYILPQLNWIPTNSIPASSSGITNWVMLNLTNTVNAGGIMWCATNIGAPGSFLFRKPAMTETTFP